MLLLVGVLAGCEEAPAAAGGELLVADYAGEAGLSIVLEGGEDTGGEPVELRLSSTTWEARMGSAWEEAEVLGVWPVVRKPALELDGEVLLAPPLRTSQELEVRYGTFPDVVTSTVAGGLFAGEWAFARGVGPIVATFGGDRRECVVYARVEEQE